MSATNKTLINGVNVPALVGDAYTSPAKGGGTRVVAMTLTNNGGTIETYSLHIVPSGGTAGVTNMLVSERALADNESDTPAEIINQLVPAGGTIEIVASTSGKINARASGVEFA